MTQAITNCYKTVEHYYWNNSTSAWEAFTGANFYRGQADNSITIGVSSADYASYRPEVYYEMRIVWTSPYSSQAAGAVEEQFKIRFFDACIGNSLTISSNLADAVHQVSDSTAATYTPSISPSVSTATCPLDQRCEIYDEASDTWVGCRTAPYNAFFTSFGGSTSSDSVSGTNGAYVVQYTATSYVSDYTAPYTDHSYLVRITFEDPRSESATSSVSDTFTLTISYGCAGDELTLSAPDYTEETVWAGGAVLSTPISFS